MKAEKFIVYRIVPFEEDVKVGESAFPREWKQEYEYKKAKMYNILNGNYYGKQ